MKKILYITTVSRTINAFLVPHIEMLLDKGFTVDCACFIDKEVDSSLINRGVKVYSLPFTRNPLSKSNYQAFLELLKIQKENHYDCVHVHTPIASIYGRLLKLKFKKLKTIYTAHGFHFHQGGSKSGWMLYYPIEKMMANVTDMTITINEEDYSRAQTFNSRAVHKINGVGVDLDEYNEALFDREQLREKYQLHSDDFVIAMVAEVNQNKNHDQMIRAISMLKERGIMVKVLCAGEGTLLEEVRMRVKQEQLDNQIHMLGFSNQIKEIIALSDMGLLLSYREGLPRSVMELMCFKKPVIGTKIRGNRDLIEHGVSGFLVEVGDAKATADYIEMLYNDRHKLSNMGEAAALKMNSYSLDFVLTQLESILVEGVAV